MLEISKIVVKMRIKFLFLFDFFFFGKIYISRVISEKSILTSFNPLSGGGGSLAHFLAAGPLLS